MELTIEDVMKSLQNRRKNGGCSAWREIGLKWISDNERYDLLKYDWEWDYIKRKYKMLKEEDKPGKLKMDIPDSPFDGGEKWEIEVDDERGFDDEDERLSDTDWEMIEKDLNSMKWKKPDTSLEEYLDSNSHSIQRSFYCYVVSQMDDEDLHSYIGGFRQMLIKYYKDNEAKKIPDEVKGDEDTMDFKRQEIDRKAEELSNRVIEDLFLLLNCNVDEIAT